MGKSVLVVGVARPLAARIAASLQRDPTVDSVVGVDSSAPELDLPGVKLVEAEFGEARSSTLYEILSDFAVDTVVHMGLIAAPGGAGGRATMKEINVLGTMQLLAACQRAPALRSVVVKSSGVVYGSSARDPAVFTEDMEPREPLRSGFAKDSLEVEGYVRGFSRRRPDVSVTLLRMANVVGSCVDSPLTTYLTLPVWPTPMGFDARLQLLHEDDALDVLHQAASGPVHGTFNVAGDGVLLLSQAARRAGRPTVPVPAPVGGWVGAAFRRAGVADFSPEQMRFLSYGRVLDCSRARDELGFVAGHSTAEAFDAVLKAQGMERIVPADLVDRLVGRAGEWMRGGAR